MNDKTLLMHSIIAFVSFRFFLAAERGCPWDTVISGLWCFLTFSIHSFFRTNVTIPYLPELVLITRSPRLDVSILSCSKNNVILVIETKRPHDFLPMSPRKHDTVILIQRPSLSILRHESQAKDLVTISTLVQPFVIMR